MNAVLKQIGDLGLIPVVVLDHIESAVPAAKALSEGGLPVMEITMRTEHGIPAIRKIKEVFPEMLIGAGTVLSMEKAVEAADAGAEFIVTPGLNEDIAGWCQKEKIALIPGCVTPSEIERAQAYGIQTVKFFPASVYGGIDGIKALNGPYRHIRFVPTGGVDLNNLADYAGKEYIHAVGGGFLCKQSDLAAGNFSKITETAKQAVQVLLGFELAHIGINTEKEDDAVMAARMFDEAFGFTVKEGASSVFAGSFVEVMKSPYLGSCGHIAVKTNSLARALYYLEKRGFKADYNTAKEKNGRMTAIYLERGFAGFAVHLMQK